MCPERERRAIGAPTTGNRIYKAGTKYTSAYRKATTACTAEPVTGLVAYYGLGAEVPASEFQAATLSVE